MAHPAVVAASRLVFDKNQKTVDLRGARFVFAHVSASILPPEQFRHYQPRTSSVGASKPVTDVTQIDGKELILWGDSLLQNETFLLRTIEDSSSSEIRSFLDLALRHDELLMSGLQSAQGGLVGRLWELRRKLTAEKTIRLVPTYLSTLASHGFEELRPVRVEFAKAFQALPKNLLNDADRESINDTLLVLTNSAATLNEAAEGVRFIQSLFQDGRLRPTEQMLFAACNIQCAKLSLFKSDKETSPKSAKEQARDFLHLARPFILGFQNRYRILASLFNMYSAQAHDEASVDQKSSSLAAAWEHAMESGDRKFLQVATKQYARFVSQFIDDDAQAAKILDQAIERLQTLPGYTDTEAMPLAYLHRSIQAKLAHLARDSNPHSALCEARDLLDNYFLSTEEHTEEVVRLKILAEELEEMMAVVPTYVSFARNFTHIADLTKFAGEGRLWAISHLIDLAVDFCQTNQTGPGLHVLDNLIEAVDGIDETTRAELKLDLPDLRTLRAEFLIELHESEDTVTNEFLEKAAIEIRQIVANNEVLSADGQLTLQTNLIRIAIHTEKFQVITSSIDTICLAASHPEVTWFRFNQTVADMMNALNALEELEPDEIDLAELGDKICECVSRQMSRPHFELGVSNVQPLQKLFTKHGYLKEAESMAEALDGEDDDGMSEA